MANRTGGAAVSYPVSRRRPILLMWTKNFARLLQGSLSIDRAHVRFVTPIIESVTGCSGSGICSSVRDRYLKYLLAVGYAP
jgi:hypothetical protein